MSKLKVVVDETVTSVDVVDDVTTISITETFTTLSESVAGVQGPTGSTGAIGPANTLTVGTVTSNTTPSATITGTSPNQVLNLVLAKGDKGDKGDTGATGATGATGSSGVVSVTSPITNAGTSTAAVIGVDQSLLAIGPTQVTGTAVITTDTRLSNTRTPTDGTVTDAKIATTLSATKITNTAAVLGLANAFTVGGHTITNAITTVIPLLIKGAASQTANLQEWQNSATTVISRVASDGLIRSGANIIGNALIGATGNATITDTTPLVRIQANTTLGGGWFQANSLTSQTGNVATGVGQIYFRTGTNAGTLKLVTRAGSGAEVTVVDNIPQ